MSDHDAPWTSVTPWVIAEVGVNHNGDAALAHRLIDTAAEAGADCVKFQTFDPDQLVSADTRTAPYQERTARTRSQRSMLAALILPDGVWIELMDHAAERGVVFLSTAFDVPTAERLVSAGMSLVKVPSGELTNLSYIGSLAELGVPAILSTGMGTLKEVGEALAAAERAPSLSILHCVTSYPAPEDQANLHAIETLRAKFGVPVGWSDHTSGSLTAMGAVALGAAILEKHVTLDNAMEGPDHAASAEPDEFARYVADARLMRRALGDGVKQPQPSELENMAPVRRSWHATRDLARGHRLTPDDVVALRPAVGIPPSVDLSGRQVGRHVSSGHPIRPVDLLDPAGGGSPEGPS